MGGNGLGHSQHVLQVGATVFVGRRAHGDELHVAVRHSQRGVVAKAQTAVFEIALHQRVQAGFPNGQHANVEVGNFEWINVHADHVVADFCQAGATDQAYIAGAKDGNFHGKSVGEIGKKKPISKARAILSALYDALDLMVVAGTVLSPPKRRSRLANQTIAWSSA